MPPFYVKSLIESSFSSYDISFEAGRNIGVRPVFSYFIGNNRELYVELREAYEILSLPFGAPLDDVKKAFHDEAQLCHPDRHSTSSDGVRKRAEERFKLINEANQVITVFNERFGKFERSDGSSEEIVIDKEPHQPESKEALGMFMVGENRRFETQIDSFKYVMLYMIALFFAFRASDDSWTPVLIVISGGVILLVLRFLLKRRG